MYPFRTRLVISAVAVTKKSLQNLSKPTRGLEPRTPSLRELRREDLKLLFKPKGLRKAFY